MVFCGFMRVKRFLKLKWRGDPLLEPCEGTRYFGLSVGSVGVFLHNMSLFTAKVLNFGMEACWKL